MIATAGIPFDRGTPYDLATSRFLSKRPTLTLTTLKSCDRSDALVPCFIAESNILQSPHQLAPKTTMTGVFVVAACVNVCLISSLASAASLYGLSAAVAAAARSTKNR